MPGEATSTPAEPPIVEVPLRDAEFDHLELYLAEAGRPNLATNRGAGAALVVPFRELQALLAEVRRTRWLLNASPWRKAVDALPAAEAAWKASQAVYVAHANKDDVLVLPGGALDEAIARTSELEEDLQIRLDDLAHAQEEVLLTSAELARGGPFEVELEPQVDAEPQDLGELELR